MGFSKNRDTSKFSYMTNTNLQSTYIQILGYNKTIRRQTPLPGGKPACGRFPRLVLFYLSAFPTERLEISITSAARQQTAVILDVLQGLLTQQMMLVIENLP